MIAVIPLQSVKLVPCEPPVNLPKRPDEFSLGTKSAALLELDTCLIDKEHQICLNALKERDRLEESGFGDQLNEIQESSWPVEQILAGGFKIEMCWTYRDDEGNETLNWCRGVVDSIVRNKSEEKIIEVMIKWNENCIEEEDLNPT